MRFGVTNPVGCTPPPPLPVSWRSGEVDARRLEERADEPPGAPAVHLARVALLAVNEPVVLVQSATAHEHREPHPEQHPDEREEQDVDEHGLDGDD
eukprot:3112424-Rhodomonas_salina.2